MREFNLYQVETGHLLTLSFSPLGIDRGMCHHVAHGCCSDCAAFYYGQDVLCAMPRYEFVSESSGREDGLEKSEDCCSVNFFKHTGYPKTGVGPENDAMLMDFSARHLRIFGARS